MSAARNMDGDKGHDDLVSAPKMVLHGFVSKHLFNNFDPDMPYSDMNRLLSLVRVNCGCDCGRIVLGDKASWVEVAVVSPVRPIMVRNPRDCTSDIR